MIRDHVVCTVLRCNDAKRVSGAFLVQRTRRPHSSCTKAQKRFIFWQTRTKWRDMNCTLGTTQGIRHFKNAQKAEENCHQGNFGVELPLTLCFDNLGLLQQWCFAGLRTPNARYLKCRTSCPLQPSHQPTTQIHLSSQTH
jgi:hypothetical protein